MTWELHGRKQIDPRFSSEAQVVLAIAVINDNIQGYQITVVSSHFLSIFYEWISTQIIPKQWDMNKDLPNEISDGTRNSNSVNLRGILMKIRIYILLMKTIYLFDWQTNR